MVLPAGHACPTAAAHAEEAVALVALTYRPAAAATGQPAPPAHVCPIGHATPAFARLPAGQYAPGATVHATPTEDDEPATQ